MLSLEKIIGLVLTKGFCAINLCILFEKPCDLAKNADFDKNENIWIFFFIFLLKIQVFFQKLLKLIIF